VRSLNIRIHQSSRISTSIFFNLTEQLKRDCFTVIITHFEI